MAYLDTTSLHSLPVHFTNESPEAASILFPQGPQWTRRYQKMNNCEQSSEQMVYGDQGPPMYRLLGAHYQVIKVPPRTDYSFPARSFHYELRQDSSPNYKNGAHSFPAGPPPPQVAMMNDQLCGTTPRNKNVAILGVPDRFVSSVKVWDKYRYLTGPPSEAQICQRGL